MICYHIVVKVCMYTISQIAFHFINAEEIKHHFPIIYAAQFLKVLKKLDLWKIKIHHM